MKAAGIFKGQTYVTTMLNRFVSEKKVLSPIKVLAHVEGFVIFKRDEIRFAITAKNFIETYIKACKYKLKNKDFEYKGRIVVWADNVYNIGDGLCAALTVSEAKSKIDEMFLPRQRRTECKPSFTLHNGDKIKF